MINSKQRAYLKSLAHHEKPMVTVGKNQVTPELVTSVAEVLKARELIKINVLDSATMDIDEVAEMISERTRSQIVQVIGKRIVLYKRNPQKPVIEFPKR